MAFIWIFTIESHDRKPAADCKAGSQDDEEYDESRADLEAHVVSLLEDHRGLVLDVHRLLGVITARLAHCKLWWTFGQVIRANSETGGGKRRAWYKREFAGW